MHKGWGQDSGEVLWGKWVEAVTRGARLKLVWAGFGTSNLPPSFTAVGRGSRRLLRGELPADTQGYETYQETV